MPSDNYDAHAGLERIRAYVEDLRNERDRLERERDEAVALLRELADAGKNWDDFDSKAHPANEIYERARAFLARTKA